VKAGTVIDGTVKAGTINAGTVRAGTVRAGTVIDGTVKAGTVKAGTVGLRIEKWMLGSQIWILEGVIIRCLGADCEAESSEMHLTFFHRLLAQTFNKRQLQIN